MSQSGVLSSFRRTLCSESTIKDKAQSKMAKSFMFSSMDYRFFDSEFMIDRTMDSMSRKP